MINVDFNDNYIGKLHKALNNKRHKHEVLYAHYLDRMEIYLYNVRKLRRADNNEGLRNDLLIIHIDEYKQAKNSLKYHQKKLRKCKQVLATIHRTYAEKGIEGIKIYKTLLKHY